MSIRKWRTYSALKKEWNSDTAYTIDEPGKHAECNKQDTKGQILYDSTLMGYLEQTNAEAEGIMEVTRGWVEWRTEVTA